MNNSSKNECNPEDIDITKCDDSLKNKDARTACEEIIKQKEEVLAAAQKDQQDDELIKGVAAIAAAAAVVATGGAITIPFLIAGAIGLYGPEILNAMSSSSLSQQQSIVSIKNELNSKTVIETTKSCVNKSSSTQINKVVVSKECAELIIDITGKPPEIKNITQSNQVRIQQNCVVIDTLNALQQLSSSISNSALQAAINEASGLFSNAQSEQTNCTDISNSINACTYIQQNQCCFNNFTSMQKNVIDVCAAKVYDISQNNLINAAQKCALKSDISVSTDTLNEIDNKVVQQAKNKAVGIDTTFLIVIAIIIFLLTFGSFLGPVVSKGSGSSIFLIVIGFIFLFVSIGFIFWYNSSKIEGYSAKNAPVSLCDNTKIQSSPTKSTYGKVKEENKNNNDIIGYDFFPDKEKDKETIDIDNIKDDNSGMVVYITEIKENDTCKPIKDGEKSLTEIKTQENKLLLYFGIILLIISIIQIIAGFATYFNTQNKKKKSLV